MGRGKWSDLRQFYCVAEVRVGTPLGPVPLLADDTLHRPRLELHTEFRMASQIAPDEQRRGV